MKPWVKKALKGNFDAIPEDLRFNKGGEDLAMMIDGCEIAGNATKCAEIAWPVIAQVRAKGESSAPALDQWLALHYQARCYQQSRRIPVGNDLDQLHVLTWSLRKALVNLAPKAKAGILSLINQTDARA